MKCIEVSNVNYDQFERLAKRYELSTPRLMGSIIDFFKQLPISPVESDLVSSMIRFFTETGINPLEPGEDLSLVLMKRVLAELKDISSSTAYHTTYASTRQDLRLEGIDTRTKALALAVENITFLIRLQDRAAAAAPPQVNTQQLVSELVTAFMDSKSVSVLVGDDPMNTLSSRAVELTRSHLQAAHALYKQELPAKRGLRSWFSWFSQRDDALEREQIMELARQLHENEAKQVLAGRASEAFVPLLENIIEWEIPGDTRVDILDGLQKFTVDEENEFFESDETELTGVEDYSGVQAFESGVRWRELPDLDARPVWDFPDLLDEDPTVDLTLLDEDLEEYPREFMVENSEADNKQYHGQIPTPLP